MLHARTEVCRCDKRRKKNLHADLGYYGAKCSETIKKFGYNPIVPIKKQKGKSKPLMTTESKLNNAIRSPACPVRAAARVETYFGWLHGRQRPCSWLHGRQ